MPSHERGRSDLQKVCHREPALDYVVLTSPIQGVDGKIWAMKTALVRSGLFSINRLYIYSCADLR